MKALLDGGNMMKQARLRKIKQYMEKHKVATIDDFKPFLNVSESTIRRDVKTLVQQGVLSEAHGSVELIEKNEVDRFINLRLQEGTEAKDKIGQKAAQMIPDDAFIYIDAGSTTFHMIKHLKANNITVCTNGINIAVELAKYNIHTMVLSGTVKPTTLAIVGEEAVESIQNFNFDLAFMGTNGVSNKGFSTPDIKEGVLKKHVMLNARRNVVLAEANKQDITTAYIFAARDAAQYINESDDTR